MYLLRADVESKIPPAQIAEALDDNGDLLEDPGLWAKMLAAVESEIDGALSRRYSLPLSDPPAYLRAGACALACESLFQRRGIPAEGNPFTAQAAAFRSLLGQLASGKQTLQVGTAPTKPPISIIYETSTTTPSRRLNG
jgi:phage gp36-like protein